MGLKEHQNANKKKKMESTVAGHTHHSIHWEVTTMLDHGRGQELLFLQISLFEFLTFIFIVHAVVVSYRVHMMTGLRNNFISFPVLRKVTNHFQTSLVYLAVAGMYLATCCGTTLVVQLFSLCF